MSISGALAWNPDVAMSQQEMDDFLSGRWVARIATNSSDGYPVVTPLWYYWDGVCLYFNIARSRLTLKISPVIHAAQQSSTWMIDR